MLTTRSGLRVPLLLALAALSWASQAVAQTRVPTHVACVGDSITYGYNASSANAAYPSVMQGLFGSSVQVMNFGKNSATMLTTGDLPYENQTQYPAATTFVSGAGSSAVVDVIIMLGTNDSKPENWMTSSGTRAQQYVTDYSAMVDHFTSLATHPKVFLAFPPRAFTNTYGIDGTVIHDQILPLIQQVATAKGMPIIDLDTPTAGLSSMFPDGVHPNDTGYALVAQLMHDGLLSAGGSGGGGGISGQGGASTSGSGGQGGAKGSGGMSAAGGRRGSGGVTATGGRVGSGGVTGSGGSQSSNGGASATGGRAGSGGVTGSGGSQSSNGGASATGGRTGGSVGTASGGTSTGGTASGGITASGGAVQSGAGGSSGSGVTATGSGGSSGTAHGGGSGSTDADAGSGVSTLKGGCAYGSSGRESGSAVLLLAGLAYLVRRRRVR